MSRAPYQEHRTNGVIRASLQDLDGEADERNIMEYQIVTM